MLSFPRISGNLEIFRKTCSVTLTSARHTDFSRIKDAATDYTLLDDDEGAMKVLGSLLAGIVHTFVHSS